MSVAKRNDGRWLVKFKDTAGCWKQRSFRSEEEARQFDADCQYDNVENSRLTLLEAVLVYLKNTEHAEYTVEQYEFIVCGHDRKNGTHRTGPAEILADRFADTLNRRDLETVRENCRADGLSPASTNAYVGKLKAALNWCVENDLLHENPWAKYRQLPGVKHKPRTGTLEEFQRLYPVLPPWLQWASRTAIALCLRPGVSVPKYKHLPKFPGTSRDIAVVVPLEVSMRELEGVIRANAGELLTDAKVFDVYTGKQVADGCKSMAFNLTFQAGDRTLTDTEIDTVIKNVVDKVGEEYKAKLRA